MTLDECYRRLGGDYPQARERLMNDRLVDRFIRKFLADNSMEILRCGLESQNLEEAFRGAHTLKGVAANLSFTELYKAAAELTEQLRTGGSTADPLLVEKVEKSYEKTIAALHAYMKETE